MEKSVNFSERPIPMDWGLLKIIPLNIIEEIVNDNGNTNICYRADLVPKVKQPVTVNTIVDAAINSEFTQDEQSYIMCNINDSENQLVIKFNNFVKDITEAAKAAGY